MATEVAVIYSASGVQTFYSTYAAARSAAAANDLIQIWADLTDEQILLKDGVDIWIAPQTVIDMTSDMPTILNDGNVSCNIFGNGIIKNSYHSTSTGDHYECIRITDSDSKVSIQCDYIEGIGTVYSGVDANDGYSILVEGLVSSQSFQLQCNKVINKNNSAIVFRNYYDADPGNVININVKTVVSGTAGVTNSGRTALDITGNGFINIDEVICPNKGSCLVHRSGNITATILKLTTMDSSAPAVWVGDGDESQNLQLYFDEIQNNNTTSGDAVKVSQGRANIIGRRIYSNKGKSLLLTGDVISAFIQSNQIVSGGRCIEIGNTDEQIVIDANYIEGNTGSSDGTIYCNSNANFLLRNAKITNMKTTGSTPFAIGIYLGSSGSIDMELEKIVIVTSDTDATNARTIFSEVSRNVKNLGLYVNKHISSNITLKIGTEVVTGNYKYIVSTDLTLY